MNIRKSSKEFWDQNWKLAGDGLKSKYEKKLFWKRLDSIFDAIFFDIETANLRLIEIGAGASEWLPRLNFRYLFNVSGLDYSKEGCERARRILEDAGVPGHIYYGDMFVPPNELIGTYDVVCSFGLVEHFSDTKIAINACAKFLKPGGIIVTLIPNMKGLNGLLYKTLSKNIYETHVPLDLNQLTKAHIDVGLKVYFGSYLMGLPNLIDGNKIESLWIKRYIRKGAYFITRLIWWLEEKGIGVAPNPLTSPYIVCAAKRPQS
jgi:2-polyprenyl-3-methyl-5-hydroxy-6-metoxy-1,4-benzoquinol methylase